MKLLILALLFVCLNACAKAKSQGTQAEIIPAPNADYICFVIRDDEGKAIGGNCDKK